MMDTLLTWIEKAKRELDISGSSVYSNQSSEQTHIYIVLSELVIRWTDA